MPEIQINDINPLGLPHSNFTYATPIQSLEHGSPMQEAFNWYEWNLFNGDAVSQLMFPGIAQFSEWSQQMVAQMYQNWWTSEGQRMQRGIAAGINPYLLANGIAGASFPSVSPPPSAVGSGANSMNAIGNLGNMLFSGAKDVVGSYAQMSKLRSEINNLDADTEKKFMDMGFTSLQSKAMSISLKYMDEKEQIGVWQCLANLDKTKQEYANLVETHNNLIAEYDKIIAQKDLLIAQEGEVQALKKVHEAEAARLKAVTQWQQIETNFFIQHRFKIDSPIYEGIRNSIVENMPINALAFGDYIVQYQGKLDSAYFNAQATASWNKRPSTMYEMSAWIGASVGKGLRDLVLKSTNSSSLLDALAKVSNKDSADEFNDAYDDAKSELYSNYRAARREYRSARRSSATNEYKTECYNRMVKAKKEYDSFTKEKFSDSLVKSLQPKFE